MHARASVPSLRCIAATPLASAKLANAKVERSWGCACNGQATATVTALPTTDCTTPNLRDEDGLYACFVGSQTIGLYTHTGGTACPTAIPTGIDLTPLPLSPTPALPPPSTTMEYSNPSREDGYGLCTCSVGTQTVGTYTLTNCNCPIATQK